MQINSPWIDRPMSALRDTVASATHCLPHGSDIAKIEVKILNLPNHEDAVAQVEGLLSERRPLFDPWVDRLDTAIQAIQKDSSITSTLAFQERLELGERAIQRVFSNYLGVTPKWVVQRARMHDALQALAVEQETPLVHLATRLGFFDQAHFARCFRQHTGQSPQQYRQALRGKPHI